MATITQTSLAGAIDRVRLGGEHVLALRGIAAKGDDGIRPYQLGGIGNVNYLPLLFDTTALNAPFNRRDFRLRGYDQGLPQLTGTQMRRPRLNTAFRCCGSNPV